MSTASELAMGGEGSIQPAGPIGWRNIGRALRLAVIGDAALAEALRRREAGRVTVFDGGTWGALKDGLDHLAPVSTDAVVIAHDGPRGQAEELARILRGRFLGVVLVLPKALTPLLRTYLGVVRSEGHAFLDPLMDVVSVAAQTTWALDEARRAAAAKVKTEPDDATTDEIERAAVVMAEALEAEDETSTLRAPSETVQMKPSAEALAALALDAVEAPLEAPVQPAPLAEEALFSRSIAMQMDEVRAEVAAEMQTPLVIEDPAESSFEIDVASGAVVPEVVRPRGTPLGRIGLEGHERSPRRPPPAPPPDERRAVEVVSIPPPPEARSGWVWLVVAAAVVLAGLALGVWGS